MSKVESIALNVEGNNPLILNDTSYYTGINAITASYNVGIGTNLPNGGLVVMPSGSTGGNVGIGTWIPAGALDIKTGNNVLVENGNVGIGSIVPGMTLDVQGTIRTSGYIQASSMSDSSNTPRVTITSTEVDVNLQ